MAVDRAQVAVAGAVLGVSTGAMRSEGVEGATCVSPPAQCPVRVASRTRPESGGAGSVPRELDERRRESVAVAGRYEDAALAFAQEEADLAEVRGDRASSGAHVLDDLERREVEGR